MVREAYTSASLTLKIFNKMFNFIKLNEGSVMAGASGGAVNAIVVTMPFPFMSRGGYRALLSIKEYKRRGINPFLVLPWNFQFFSQEKREEDLRLLSREGINVYGVSLLPWCARSNIPMRISARLLASLGLPIKIMLIIMLPVALSALYRCMKWLAQ
ncbi:MAG: hypothetical protein QXW39_03115 [Candidatus Bathyarchaeia archaeon]